jgi:hypothetical protein
VAAAIPEQRNAQERLWKALTALEYLQDDEQREQAEIELVMAWTYYEDSRAD